MVTPSLILQAAQSLSTPHKVIPEDSCFLGFTATKKLGKAHIRNRTKRRLRAAAQQIFPHLALNGIDYVLIGRYNTKDVAFANLQKDMEFALKRINKMMTENKTAVKEDYVAQTDDSGN